MKIKNFINECIECHTTITVNNPQEGDTVICSHCGAFYKVETTYSLKTTGLFDKRYKK